MREIRTDSHERTFGSSHSPIELHRRVAFPKLIKCADINMYILETIVCMCIHMYTQAHSHVCPFIGSEQSERDTIRGDSVLVRYMYIYLLGTPPHCSVEINVFELG